MSEGDILNKIDDVKRKVEDLSSLRGKLDEIGYLKSSIEMLTSEVRQMKSNLESLTEKIGGLASKIK